MLINIPPRPNRLTEEKDESYHVRYARWSIGQYNVYSHQAFVGRYLTNIAFYKGNQWIFDEDLDPFLADESGDVRNRIKWVHNIIKPFVEYYRGAAIKMDLNSEIISTSRESKNRRDKALDKLLFFSRMAEQMDKSGNPQAASDLRSQTGVGMNDFQTTQRFNNTFTDEYVKTAGLLKDYIANIANKTNSHKVKLAEDLALAGIGIEKETDRGGEQVWSRLPPERFIFDMSAEDSELLDAEFMGEFHMRSPVDIFEEFPNTDMENMERIEKSSMANIIGLHNIVSFYTNYAQKIPTYEMYWRDIEVTKHAAFYDSFGYPVLEEVSKDRPIETAIPVAELAQYAEDYEWIKLVLNDGRDKITKNYKSIPCDKTRFCKFVPGEYLNGAGAGTDIVLEWGIRPYSQRYSSRYKPIEYPYKVSTYSYILGEIMSPIDALISPQRFLNRTLSIAESAINNSRGAGTVFDKDTIDAQGGEEELQRNTNMSKPVFVNANRNLNNAIGSYDFTVKAGTMGLFDIADKMKMIANDVFGGGQQVIGQGGAYRATGAVAQQNLSQGITMQEPFFVCLERIYMQMYDSMVDRGKRIYIANQRTLSMEVGDEGVVIFKLTKEYELEDFRSRIIRSADYYTERDAANQLLIALYQMQLIDDKTYASGFNNSTTADVAYLLRQFTGLKVQAQVEQVNQQTKNQPLQLQQAKAADDMQDANQDKQFAQEAAINTSNNKTKIIQSAIAANAQKEKQDKAAKTK